jgi:hypothetical protein
LFDYLTRASTVLPAGSAGSKLMQYANEPAYDGGFGTVCCFGLGGIEEDVDDILISSVLSCPDTCTLRSDIKVHELSDKFADKLLDHLAGSLWSESCNEAKRVAARRAVVSAGYGSSQELMNIVVHIAAWGGYL